MSLFKKLVRCCVKARSTFIWLWSFSMPLGVDKALHRAARLIENVELTAAEEI